MTPVVANADTKPWCPSSSWVFTGCHYGMSGTNDYINNFDYLHMAEIWLSGVAASGGRAIQDWQVRRYKPDFTIARVKQLMVGWPTACSARGHRWTCSPELLDDVVKFGIEQLYGFHRLHVRFNHHPDDVRAICRGADNKAWTMTDKRRALEDAVLGECDLLWAA
jgi:hypothetical protein